MSLEAAAATHVPKVILIGLSGFGRQHLLNIERLVSQGKMRLVAGVDLHDPGNQVRGDTPVYPSLELAQADGHRADIVIVSTPINTHFNLAMQALHSGAHVLLEKPPTATLAQYEQLVSEAERTGLHVQVGFQSIGSEALSAIEQLLAAQEIGQLRAVGATGLWLRTRSYYQRSAWAGRRTLNGVEVVDGVVTNPLAHAVKTALHIAGARKLEDVAELTVETHHAHEIEADDTSIVQLSTATGIPVTAALTLCAAEQEDPWITIWGTEGHAVFYYTRDELVITPNQEAPGAGKPTHSTYARTDLLENLIDVVTGRAHKLRSPLEDHGAFMKVLEAIRTSEDPLTIAPDHVLFHGEGDQSHPVIPGIKDFIARAVKAAPSSFSSLGAPWAAAPATDGQLHAGPQNSAVRVANLRNGEDISPTDSPRPFLDELTTIGGIAVSDQQPEDHTWHLGVGVALQDVNGTNFWGGRAYTRDQGRYIWREDHGRIRVTQQELTAGKSGSRLVQQLTWDTAEANPLVSEQRRIMVHAKGGSRWDLDYSFSLTPAGQKSVSLGSPGSNGRTGGGYGGFFWRLPAVKDAQIRTAEEVGEENVHGSLAPWLAFSGTFEPLPNRHGRAGDATLIFVREEANPDPWFVRCAGYPGVGMSLAWDTPVVLSPGDSVDRRLRVLVIDSRLDSQEIDAALRAS